ncbi:helix-turn-helix protein [Rhodopseudomonas thermotolerans]|uniref:Helix-turn-helix protein n=2 Tax=Rhodopseudomonas TaxID=1073 RepID=A0A336JTH6_9BRAD|nr:helix-turn-helix protein [Rhodopseudomonas pentothenatexigens]REF90406.1 helix-turn-helix protein [Rhodopseudomonas thermotolerans]SSW93105.1 helix-turn-helix protein [Rhodopseudomonas pentothenatexigens]
MPSNSRGVISLDWKELVAEAIRRRKAEKMTQREHAALAGVSIPTIVSFDRGERSLTLEKAFDILRVVGLVKEPDKGGAQESFVQDAFKRWRELTSKLPADSPGRFSNGWYRIDYALEGDLKSVELHKFRDLLQKAVIRHTGWPLFLFMTRPEYEPHEQDGVIECWLKPEEAGGQRSFADPAHCDFWRASPNGRAFIIRGYQEDGQETFPSRTVFDTTLPVWRIGEALLHAQALANQLAEDRRKVKVKLRVLYTGLSGRVLRSWANPMSDLFMEGGAARSDEAVLEATVPVAEIDDHLALYVHPLVASLYERFGVTGLSVDRVAAELARLRGGRF